MSANPAQRTDDDLLAEVFDELLQSVLDGRSPALETLLPDRPDLRDRVRETWSLASSVAGRHEASKPVLGGYTIVRELGRGGMGTVYLARHEELDRDVAIKILPESLAFSPHGKRRFLEEARALARLKHDHVVGIHRIVDQSDMLAFEMEYVEGPSLQQLLVELRERGPAPTIDDLAKILGLPAPALGARTVIEFFVRTGITVARALAAVHRAGLVHRDVKPSNVLLRKHDGRPVLVDFGLARDDDDFASGRTDAFAGTPVYAAPERLRHGDLALTGRADVYSLGVTLYEAIALVPPHRVNTTAEVLRRIESGALKPLRKVAPHVSRDLETVIAKAMEPDTKDRYATADEFADDLERLLSLQPVRARPASAVRRLVKAARRHRKMLFAIAGGALLGVVAAWPALVHASAREREATARAHVRTARLKLMSPEVQQLSAPLGEGMRLRSGALTVPNQVDALAAAVRDYETALAAAPTDADLRLEHAVVRAAHWLRTVPSGTRGELDAVTQAPATQVVLTPLPPLCRATALEFLRGEADATRVRAAEARPEDRFATGLLALLLADLAVCDAAWSSLATDRYEHPVLDPALGILFAADGFPERAYPRLFHAAREYPESWLIARELSEAALAMGDPGLARQWLERAQRPSGAADDPRLSILEGDLARAAGKDREAEGIYAGILRRFGPQQSAYHRLALLALDRDDLASARRQLERLLELAPSFNRARLDLARTVLRQGDVAAYLAAARQALARTTSRHRSRGAARDDAEILRLGGLHSLAQPERESRGARDGDPPPFGRRGEPIALPLATHLPTSALPHVAAWLEVLVCHDRAAGEKRATERRPLFLAVHGVSAVLARWKAPMLRAPWPAWAVAAVANGPRLERFLEWLEPRLLPFQRSLGAPLRFHEASPLLVADHDPEMLVGAAVAGLLRADTTTIVAVGTPPMGSTGSPGIVKLHDCDDGRVLATLRPDRDEAIFGQVLANAGDVDGDGYDDLAVGEPLRRERGAEGGAVSVWSVRDGTLLRRVPGPGVGYGIAVAALGGEGARELVVGAVPVLRNATALGAAYVLSATTGEVRLKFEGDRAGVWFGAAVGNAGDVDGDGRDDVIVGGNLPGAHRAKGHVRVHSGADGARLHVWIDDEPEHEFGAKVGSLGDVNGDGRSDLFVTAPGGPDAAPQPGRVLIYCGKTGAVLHVLRGDDAGDRFGETVCALADWFGYGRSALAVGATLGGSGGGGYVRVFDRQKLQPLRTFFAPPGHGGFGRALADGGADAAGRQRLVVPSHRVDSKIVLWRFVEPDPPR